MSNDRLEAALGYVRRGWAVFPVHGFAGGTCTCGRADCSSPGKHPRIRGGLRAAVTDEHQIRKWWDRWPHANVAVSTGTASGIVVVDLDLPAADDSLDLLASVGLELPPTLTALTGAGRHLYYACVRELPNKARGLPGYEGDLPGLDLRADGGYVVAPPSVHVTGSPYRWLDPDADLAQLPQWIWMAQRRRKTPRVTRAPDFDGAGTPYGLAALADEVGLLLNTPEGARNDQLNRSAFMLGQLIAGGHLDESAARSVLKDAALRTGLQEAEIGPTIDSGVSSGKHEPRGEGANGR